MKKDYLCVADGDSRLESAESSLEARNLTLSRFRKNGYKAVRVSVYIPGGPITMKCLLESEQWILKAKKWILETKKWQKERL